MSPLPDDNPKTAFGEQKPPMSDTPTTAVRALGRVMRLGATKYGRFNWRAHNVSSTVYYDAAMRHLMAWFDGEDTDCESGQSHLAHVMACCAILIDAREQGTLNDNRAPTLPTREFEQDFSPLDTQPRPRDLLSTGYFRVPGTPDSA